MRNAKPRVKVLFLCTGNSCRSQMAEGFARALCGRSIEPYSAGVVAKGLDPRSVAVMAEVGVDIAGQRSKCLNDLRDPVTRELPVFDLVVTVCDAAREACPVFPGRARMLHQSFDDPPELARDAASEEEALRHYRRVSDEIRAFVVSLPDKFPGPAQTPDETAQVEGEHDG
jgi:arsenate reductase (thioredoxin)